MRKYLLDTHIVIWILEDDKKRLGEFLDILTNTHNNFFVSIASYWEIMIKTSIGRLKISDNLHNVIEESGMKWLEIRLEHLDHIRKLSQIHQDPFDRLIVAQAKMENMKILTRDPKILQYL